MSSTPIIYLRDLKKRPGFLNAWERVRNKREVHWAMECFAEALGVFFYVYFGLGSTAAWVIGNIIKQSGLSSVFQIGFAYAFGILFAIGVCSATSGGHFNPCITIAFTIFRGFPPLKAVRYIIAQILGAYIASAVVYGQWKVTIVEAELLLMKAGVYETTNFTPNGPAGIFALYLLPGAQTLPRAFFNEFVNCFVLALVIWAALDPTSFMIPPVMAPFIIAAAYAGSIWGYAVPAISLNSARDIGCRLFALTIWGKPAAGGAYAAIAALVNIPATLLAGAVYELFLVDSDRVVAGSHFEYMNVVANHRRHRQQADSHVDADDSSHEKPNVTMYEQATGNNGVHEKSRA